MFEFNGCTRADADLWHSLYEQCDHANQLLDKKLLCINQLQCCGDSSSKLSFLNLSEVCPKRDNILEQFTIEDCHQKIDALFSTKLYLVGIAAVVVAVIMIIEMILSMVLCCGIRIYSVY
ncbi:CD81 antigen-like [Xenopus laevis]|uniref:CD81 antigen-like n=1 Tax=Xenopus laevis TaxID=8355 RepID=A0A8J1MX22_XENLA|nr:CD81 antigen-like [Xenopus laevis]